MTAPSSEIVRQVRAEYGPRTMIAFSRGKDALGAYLAIREHFEEVIPYHLWLVPGLEFVEESLAYYERVIGRKIWNLPHPSFAKWLNNYTFQPISRAAVIQAADMVQCDYDLPVSIVAELEGLAPAKVMVANGVRAADSPLRRISIMQHGAILQSQRKYMPTWDWSKDKLLDTIERSGISLPVDYLWFGRSFDGLDYRFLGPLKRHAPRDYAKVLEWFPLADLEVWRHEKSAA